MADLNYDSAVFALPAAIRAVSTEELQTLARGRAVDPSIFEEFPPFTWLCEISSTRRDAYYTEMDAATTLPNFRAAAQEGRAFLLGHNTHEMPFGATLSGELLTGADGATIVQAGAYTLQEPETAAFRNRVRAGIQRDVSVGFYNAKFICSICGKDMLRDWSCPHIPGFEYSEKAEASSEATGARVMTLCTARVVDGLLSEVSAVYEGATPGAEILQAERQARAGTLQQHQIRLLESRYHIRLPDRQIVSAGVTLGDPMPGAQKQRTRTAPPAVTEAEEEQQEQAATTEAEEAEEEETEEGAEEETAEERQAPTVAALERQLTEARATIARLEPEAVAGRQWRELLVAEALAEGVRAHGSAFAEERYKAIFARSTPEELQGFAADFRAVAEARLPGGRLTRDTETKDPEEKPKRQRPAAAFTAG